jgi:hypothetical protein
LTWALGKPAAVLTKPPGLVGRLTVEKNVDHARFIQFLFKYIIKFLSKSHYQQDVATPSLTAMEASSKLSPFGPMGRKRNNFDQ